MNARTRILLAFYSLILPFLTAPLLSAAETKTYRTTPEFQRAELDQMLAPIALYPDTVLSHVLIAATYPLEVVQADRWARANTNYSGQSAVNAVENQDWDPSVKALVAFPEILKQMSDDLDWTQRLGDAFLVDENEVMAVIQDLRQKAYASGSLKKMEYVRVQHDDRVIVIEPAVERVVYIPYYDTRAVYGRWWWPEHPPVYWQHPRNHLYIGGVYWGPRVSLGSSFFFSSFHWHRRQLVVIDHGHRHPGFHSGRNIAHYQGARHWRHNPHHRRGVDYRNDAVRHHYRSHSDNLREQRHFDRAGDKATRLGSKNIRTSSKHDQINQRVKEQQTRSYDQRPDPHQRLTGDARAIGPKDPRRNLHNQRDERTPRDERARRDDRTQWEGPQTVHQRDTGNSYNRRVETSRTGTERRATDASQSRTSRLKDKQSMRTQPARDSNNFRGSSTAREHHRATTGAGSGTGKSFHVRRDYGGSRENRR